MAGIAETLQAVKDELAGMEPVSGMEFTPETALLPTFTLKDFKSLRVTVVPRSQKFPRQGRNSPGLEMEIDIGVQKKFDNPRDYEEEGARLLGLVEKIARHFDGRRFTTLPKAICSHVVNEPVYAPEHIEQHHMFTSVITLTVKLLE